MNLTKAKLRVKYGPKEISSAAKQRLREGDDPYRIVDDLVKEMKWYYRAKDIVKATNKESE